MGNILNRYYEIDEAMDPVGKEDGDIDNDGDEDDSDEYKAIKKQKNENTSKRRPMEALKQTLKDPKDR